MIKGTTKLMCLLGSPVDHSLSPALHNELCRLNEFDGVYCAFRPDIEFIGDAIKGLKALGAIGFNVTYPYKETVIPFLDEIKEDAKYLNAVNTVVIKNNRLIGYNTDVLGVEALIKKNQIVVTGKTVAIMGTGGASRAVAFALMKLGVDRIDFYSRTPRQSDFTQKLKKSCLVEIFSYDEFQQNKRRYHLIVNGTPLGMGDKKDEQVIIVDNLRDKATLLDLIYSPWETKLLTLARKNGYNVVNGYDMLYYQGLKAFELWTGIYIDYYDKIKKILINRPEDT